MKKKVNKNMRRTIRVKIEHSKILVKTIEIFSQIIKDTQKAAIKSDTRDKTKIHHLMYNKARKKYPNMPSALLQTARDVVCEQLKRNKMKKSEYKFFSSIRLDKRTFRANLEHCIASISSIKGRQKISFKNNQLLKRYSGWSVKAATLSYRKNNLWLNIVVEKEKPIMVVDDKIIGLDRGIRQIAVGSNNQFFTSKHLRNIKGKYQFLKSALQSKGTRSAKRMLNKLSGRERRFVTDVNHCLSKKLVNSNFNIFSIEDLKIKRSKKQGKKFNKKLNGWSWKQFETYLIYKAEALGKQVLKVDPRYTSQKCSKCGNIHKQNRNKNNFKCCSCGFELHADLNAARNIAQIGISCLSRLVVNQPIVAIEQSISYKPTNSLVGN